MSSLKRKATTQPTGPEAKKPKVTHNASITSFFGAPKAGPTPTSPKPVTTAPDPTAKFDKAKWRASLTEEQRTLLQLEIDTLDESWLAVLKDDLTTMEFMELKRFLDRETKAGKKWFPPREDVYSWYVLPLRPPPSIPSHTNRQRSRHTPFPTVKVVILGQDPYHNINQAHGLAFSVRPPTPAPPSLRNMYKGLKHDYPSFVIPPREQGSLLPWADRGVLMLNTCLTVRAHEANSHANRGWEKFTQRIIDLVAARTRGVVFMAWGTPAGKRVLRVDGTKHLVLKSVHPSPLSASRGFFDNEHFRRANDWLVERYGVQAEVDWGLTEGCSTLEGNKKKKTEVEEEDEFGDLDEEDAIALAQRVEDAVNRTAAVLDKAKAAVANEELAKAREELVVREEGDEKVEPRSDDTEDRSEYEDED